MGAKKLTIAPHNGSNSKSVPIRIGGWKYTVVSGFCSEETAVSINKLNILVQSEELDDLLQWELLLDKRELDYAIVFSPETQRADSYYALITNMDQFNSTGPRGDTGLFTDEEDYEDYN